MGKSFSKSKNNHKRKKCNENSEVNLITYANGHGCGGRRFNPTWAKKPMNLINARSETLTEKPSFKMAKRCLILADGWYEWLRDGDTKQPYYFHMNNKIFSFAGIYTEYQEQKGCAIITKEANEKLGNIHHRMPVLLKYNEGRDWLAGKNVFSSSLSERIEYYPVLSLIHI